MESEGNCMSNFKYVGEIEEWNWWRRLEMALAGPIKQILSYLRSSSSTSLLIHGFSYNHSVHDLSVPIPAQCRI